MLPSLQLQDIKGSDAAPKDASGNVSTSRLTSMLPPPDPPAPHAILEPEVTALSSCFKNAVVRVGQIYGFYADIRRLGIESHVSQPPKALTAALGREIEKYDQLVDSMESQILRAISVLQRDLAREELRMQRAEEAAKAAETPSKLTASPTLVPDANEAGPPSAIPALTPLSSPRATTISGNFGRRPSAISISSLHRQPFPLKLDLSSSSMRFNPEETSIFSSALASPVTLAPKSARPLGPNEYPPDLMAFVSSNAVLDQRVDIDLTLPGVDVMNTDPKLVDIGNTADKPIELDLDAMDIDMAMSSMDGLFGEGPATDNHPSEARMNDLFSRIAADPSKSDKAEQSFLEGLAPTGNEDDLFASLGGQLDTAQPSHDPSTGPHQVPSPGTMFANFGDNSKLQGLEALSNDNMHVPDAPFDLNLDLSNLSPSFFENAGDPDVKFPTEIDHFLTETTSEEKETAGEAKKVDST